MPIVKKKAPKSKAAPAGPAPDAPEREVQHPEVSVVVCTATTGGAVTPDLAKEYLGWESETDDVKFGPDHLFTDLTGRKVRCRNNTHNRALDERWAMTIAQEHLNKRWRVNGETIIFGRYGEVMSGQHRLIGLILAEQMRQADPEKWAANWPDEVTMETLIVFGIEEADDTANTMDHVRPRTAMDVLYRSELLAKHPPAKRKALARIADYAIRLLWSRTGAKEDAYAPIKTNTEAVEFLRRHPKLLSGCVEFVEAEDNKGSLAKYLPLGTLAGLTYLMAAQDDDAAKYGADRAESVLKLKSLDKAQQFWVDLHGGGAELNALRDAVHGLVNPDTGEEGGTPAERLGMIIKAWHRYAAGEKVTPASVKLSYRPVGDEGVNVLDEHPLVGGIDLGDRRDAASTVDDVPDPTVEEVAARATAVKADKGHVAEPTVKPDAGIKEQLAVLRKVNPGHVLYFEVGDQFRLYDSDADLAVKHLGVKLDPKQTVGGVPVVSFKKSNLQPSHQAFNEAGLKIATVIQVDGEPKVTRMAPIVKLKKK